MGRRIPALVVLLLAAGCARDASGGAATPDVPGHQVMDGLCQAVSAAEDPARAEESFARVHTDLHLVARALEDDDRGAAGRLLTAKQKVEDDLRRRAPASELGPDLRRLVESTADGFARLDVTVKPCDR